jgi:hypothetical protein
VFVLRSRSATALVAGADREQAIQRAIVLRAWGLSRFPITIAERTTWAGIHVAQLGLEQFVRRRVLAGLN